MENTKRIILKLNAVEQQLLLELEERHGFYPEDSFRYGLRLFYNQETKSGRGPGRPKKEKPVAPPQEMQTEYKMSPETHCVNVLNGEVIDVDGIACCKYQLGACEITDPLSTLLK